MRAPEPKFFVGQIVMMKGTKEIPFRIIDRILEGGEWFYGWNRKNAAAEHMIRAITAEEIGWQPAAHEAAKDFE